MNEPTENMYREMGNINDHSKISKYASVSQNQGYVAIKV